jgi:hypothetical protein
MTGSVVRLGGERTVPVTERAALSRAAERAGATLAGAVSGVGAVLPLSVAVIVGLTGGVEGQGLEGAGLERTKSNDRAPVSASGQAKGNFTAYDRLGPD